MSQITLAQAHDWVEKALLQCGAHPDMAAATARSLVRAEAQGLASHGLSRVPQYVAHLRSGRAHGAAVPRVVRHQGAAVLVDADKGLAFAACELAVREAIITVSKLGVCFAGVTNSHHCGVLVDHLRPAAEVGLVGLGFANSPSAMPVAGGRHAILGTNPIAAIFPRLGHDPLMIDLSLSEVARGKLMVAAREGREIPLGWALDAQGEPTTDPQAGMAGSMLPFGAATGTKGAMLALLVELLVTALIGAQFGFEASSFFVDEGNQPRIGQAFLLIDPGALAGSRSYFDRLEVLIRNMLVDEGVRLAGARRLALERAAAQAGINIPDALFKQIQALAAG
ncbi:MAG: sulfolactate dehydrogenase [Curvibacter sp. GWA2_64_110]|nr:MAG: sulfolactate dehydrogenase [Curvibacter sp. GWA2_64_110]HCY14958.1 sulfolactate dehydrogenase [Curvibacter sp.]